MFADEKSNLLTFADEKSNLLTLLNLASSNDASQTRRSLAGAHILLILKTCLLGRTCLLGWTFPISEGGNHTPTRNVPKRYKMLLGDEVM
jgi:hypothetical protein